MLEAALRTAGDTVGVSTLRESTQFIDLFKLINSMRLTDECLLLLKKVIFKIHFNIDHQ